MYLTICLSNSITIQDLVNMQRLRFFSNSDLKNLEAMLKDKIELWMKSWVFTSTFSVSVDESSFENCTKSGVALFSIMGTTDQQVYVLEKQFDWGRFIFDNYLNLCPQDNVMNSVESTVKQNFWSDIFNLELQEGASIIPLRSSFKSFIKVCISFPDAGVLELIASSGVLYNLLNKPFPSATKLGLDTRLEAVADINVDLTVFMSFGELSFPDLIEMKVNNSIRSKLDVDNKFYVKVNNRPICYAVLGKVGDRKGVLVKETMND